MSQLYFLGICGTFMGSLALLAREQGFGVAGCDTNVYPPMSEQLAEHGIAIDRGYDPRWLDAGADEIIVGNAMARGNPMIEALLESQLSFTSGPQWLGRSVLSSRHVLAVAGTHGKTTTSSMLSSIMRHAGDDCGYLIGGVPIGLPASAALGSSPHFVIEADEYDTAFFDKRSKFIHYAPRTLIINNLEYDHADIFADLAAIQWQFHQLLRTMPHSALVLVPDQEASVQQMLELGCWSRVERFALHASPTTHWWVEDLDLDCSRFKVWRRTDNDVQCCGEVRWALPGEHNVVNGLAAIAAAADAGIDPAQAVQGLSAFTGVRRRQEVIGTAAGVTVVDDFAHHPTAIAATLAALRSRAGQDRLLAVIEPRSNTMRSGVHAAQLPACVDLADQVFWFQPPGGSLNLQAIADASFPDSLVFDDTQRMIEALVAGRRAGDLVVIMSNGGFEGLHRRLLSALQREEAA